MHTNTRFLYSLNGLHDRPGTVRGTQNAAAAATATAAAAAATTAAATAAALLACCRALARAGLQPSTIRPTDFRAKPSRLALASGSCPVEPLDEGEAEDGE